MIKHCTVTLSQGSISLDSQGSMNVESDDKHVIDMGISVMVQSIRTISYHLYTKYGSLYLDFLVLGYL